MHHRLVLAALIGGFALFAASAAQAVPVTFQVRMQHMIERGDFDPATEFVDLAGTFNEWGNNPLLALSDADGDSIYDITLDAFSVGQVFEYKFRIGGAWDGREEFPGGGSNRQYTVQPSGNEILVWYDDRAPDLGVGELSWWNDTVFYEIFVRSFQDSDGDGIGDLQGLTQKLDYLNDGDPNTDDDLGITGIWLMPIHDSPSYHGYDVVDYRSIHPDYGTMADFEAFLAAAHARGIRVVIDFVMNHSSNQHPWFQASAAGDPAYRDWYRWSTSIEDPAGPWGQPVWHFSGGNYYYGLFWSGMPDLNYDTPAVKTAMFDAASFWLDTVGVDGFRLDAVLYIDESNGQLESTPATLDFWQEYNAHVKSVRPDAMSVGEAWTNSATVNQYLVEDRLDLAFEFELSYAMLGAADSGDAGWFGFLADQVYDLHPYLQYATFLTNHDQNRVMSVLGEDEDKARVAAALLLTQPGVPFLYYGEEVGQLGTKPDPEIRRPMQWTGGFAAGFSTATPWIAPSANYTTNNVEDFAAQPGSLLHWYRSLIHARNGSEALRRGEYVLLPSSEAAVAGYLRRSPHENVLVIANTSSFALVDVSLAASVAGLDPGDLTLTDLVGNRGTWTETVDPESRITGLALGPHEVIVARLGSSTAVGADDGLAQSSIRLRPAAPNPFGESTTVRFALPAPAAVRLAVYDLAGRQVAVLADTRRDAGVHTVQWNGRDAEGRALGAGVYFLRLSTGDTTRVQKVVLTR